MKKVLKRKTAAALLLVIIFIFGIAVAAAPSADKTRADADYITGLSAASWIAPEIYSDGAKAENILLNGSPVSGEFEFELNDVLSFEEPGRMQGEYYIGFLYSVNEAKPTDTLFTLKSGTEEYSAYLPIVWKDETGDERYSADRYGNEIANYQIPCTDTVFNPLLDKRDVNLDELSFTAANGKFEIRNDTQTVTVSEIIFYSGKDAVTYEEYLKEYSDAEDNADGQVRFQGEDFSIKSDSYIRSSNINNIALTPYNTYKRLINNLDGASFASAGQKVIWEFEVENSGWYEIGLNFCQNSASSKKVCRRIEIDGAVPFAELEEYAFEQTDNNTFTYEFLSDGRENYRFYLTAGRHTIALTARLSEKAAEIYDSILTLTEEMNELGTDISKITAGVSDKNRTWDIDAYLPDAVSDIKGYIERINDIYDELEELEGEEPVYADSLKTAAEVLKKLLKSPRKIPNNLELFNTGDNSAVKYIRDVTATLTNLSLGIDEFCVKASVSGFKDTGYPFTTKIKNSVQKLLFSLTPEAQQNTVTEKNDGDLEVWMSRSSIYVQVLQGMVDSAEDLKDLKVDISIMPNEQKLVLASAAGTAPDVVIGAAIGTPFKFALRGAAKNLCDYEDFLQFYNSQYNIEGLVPCYYDGGIYGAAETQDYNVLFYRKDILEALGISVPDTWDDVKEIMPTLLRYNKNFSLPIANVIGFKSFATTSPYIYQNGGEFYVENGAGAAFLDENTVKGFEEMTELFRVYAVDDYVPNFYNSFRNGTTPLGLGGVSVYVQLTEAAPEIAGLWDIAPAPGVKASDGSVIRSMNSAQTACMIFADTQKPDEAWEFLKWWLSEQTQENFAATMELSYGTEYRWNTANLKAFEEGSYPESHKQIIKIAWENQKETVQHPASYIVEREISNAYTNVVVNGDTVIEALEKSTLLSDREIVRKLKEFGFCDSDGNLNRNYPVKVIEDIQAKLSNGAENETKQ